MRVRRVVRSPFAFWLAAAVLAVATASVVARAVSGAEALAARYGPLRPVVVATRAVEPGAEVGFADLAERMLPASFVPPGALDAVSHAAGRTAVARLEPGQTVHRGHLAPDGLRGVAALLPPGDRAVAVPAGATAPPLRPGDTVDVVATFDPATAADPALVVAPAALVLETGPETATLAVAPSEALGVAFALANGSVTLVVAPPRSPEALQRRPLATIPSTATPTTTR